VSFDVALVRQYGERSAETARLCVTEVDWLEKYASERTSFSRDHDTLA
jgi:hypothetical protein